MEKINKKIKVLMLVTVTVEAMFLAAISSTLASDHDTFNLTVKGYYIGLTVDRDSWNVNHGVPGELSSTYYTNAESKTFTANTTTSSVNVNVKLQITTDGATWHAVTSGQNAGADRYKLSESLDLWLHQVQIVTTSATTIKSDMTPGTQPFDLKMNTPNVVHHRI
ncbi:hypothetical protein MUP56_02135 [Patescibacteria group bacterium]|nr:hypothetical protein [Patescibacteria group bacterium]